MQIQEPKHTYGEDDRTVISKYTLESILLHFSKAIQRLIIALVITATMWLLTIAGFIYYLSLPDSEYGVTVENSSGNANYIGNDLNGDLNNGKDNSNIQDKEEEKEWKGKAP